MNQHIDLIYFFSSLVMAGLPLGLFTWLTYLVVKRYRAERRDNAEGGTRNRSSTARSAFPLPSSAFRFALMSQPKGEKRQVVRYAFYKLDPAWRRLTAERQASAKIEFGETLERYHGRLLLRPYGLVGIRGDCDFLLWQVAEDLDALVELQTALNRTDLGAYLSIPYSYLAMTRRSIYEFPAPPEPGHEQRGPFRRTP